MKKTLLSLAIALMGCTAFSVSAQNPSRNNAPLMQNKMYQPQEFTDFAFEGILLDMNQQQRMDSLNAAVKAQSAECTSQKDKANCQDKQNCPNKQSAKSDKSKKDKQHKPDFRREKIGARRYGPDYINKVKEILTPEQYTTFLENIVMMPYNQNGQNNQQ